MKPLTEQECEQISVEDLMRILLSHFKEEQQKEVWVPLTNLQLFTQLSVPIRRYVINIFQIVDLGVFIDLGKNPTLRIGASFEAVAQL